MAVTVRQLANLVSGEVVGDRDVVIASARGLLEAQAGDITYLDYPDQESDLNNSKAGAAVVATIPPTCSKALIRVKDPLQAFATIAQHFRARSPKPPMGIDARVVIHASARVGADAMIAAGVVIGAHTRIGRRCRLHPGVSIGAHCRLGDDVELHPNVAVYDDTVIGDRVTILTRAVIGADGFGYRFQAGRHVKVPQLGNVIIGDDVNIGAGAAIDRGTFGTTRIGAGTKIGNLAQIAHNCQIGARNILGNQVGIGGSSTTGDLVTLGDYAGVKDHIDIGYGVILSPGAGVIQDLPVGKHVQAYPAMADDEARNVFSALGDLPRLHDVLQRVLTRLDLGSATE